MLTSEEPPKIGINWLNPTRQKSVTMSTPEIHSSANGEDELFIALEEMSGKAMAYSMAGDALGNAGFPDGIGELWLH